MFRHLARCLFVLLLLFVSACNSPLEIVDLTTNGFEKKTKEEIADGCYAGKAILKEIEGEIYEIVGLQKTTLPLQGLVYTCIRDYIYPTMVMSARDNISKAIDKRYIIIRALACYNMAVPGLIMMTNKSCANIKELAIHFCGETDYPYRKCE